MMSTPDSPDLSKAPCFLRLPWLSAFTYRGKLNPKTYLFDVLSERGPARLILSTLIEKEQADIWKSCHAMLERTFKTAALGIKGFFGFDLITLDLHQGMQHFNWDMLSQLIANHCRKMQTGEVRLIQYASLYGVLHKRMQEDWGKIEFKSGIEVYTQAPEKFDLHLKKMLREAADRKGEKPDVFLVSDFGQMPIFKFGDETQTGRLKKFLESVCENQKETMPDIYVTHKDQTVELFEQFNLKGDL
ncbi:MAG: hypothetical protein H6757_05860 [Candidatus Omnitrophica bacterium]|nr:hypothetical protein [Candidatus Omnitrophota bacterium]